MIVHQVVMVKSEKQIEKHVKTNKNDLTTSQVVILRNLMSYEVQLRKTS